MIDVSRTELSGRGVYPRRLDMNRRVLGLTTSALILAYGTVGAIAQDQMTPQPEQQQTESQPMGHEGEGTTGQGSIMQGVMMGPGKWAGTT
jgi:hypothetical protein